VEKVQPAAPAPAPQRRALKVAPHAELRAALNKICPDGFPRLSTQLLASIREEGHAGALAAVPLIFGAALTAPAYCRLYATLLVQVAEEHGEEVEMAVVAQTKRTVEETRGDTKLLVVVGRFVGTLTSMGVVPPETMATILDLLLADPTSTGHVEAAVVAVVALGVGGVEDAERQELLESAFRTMGEIRGKTGMRMKVLIDDAEELRKGGFKQNHRVLNTLPPGKKEDYVAAPEDPSVYMPQSDDVFGDLQFHTEVGRRVQRFDTLRSVAKAAYANNIPFAALSGTLNLDKVVEVIRSAGHTVVVIRPGMSDKERVTALQQWERCQATCVVAAHECSPRSYTLRRKGASVCVFDFPKSRSMYWPWLRKLGSIEASVTTLLTLECDRKPAILLAAWLRRTGRAVPPAVTALIHRR